MILEINDVDSPHTTTVEDPESVDTWLAKEFLSLSFQDRNAIVEEMHGVSCLTPEETPRLIYTSLERLEHEISLIPTKNKKMYDLCQKKYGRKNSREDGGSYVNDVDFRMRFLRAELFDATKAARRLVLFLENLVDLFGEYALQRPILLSDFTEDELQIFRMGNLQLLPFRDRSGRRIVVGVEGLAMQFKSALRFKILYYLLWVASEDLETQSKGVVCVLWPVNDIALRHIQNKELLMLETQKKRTTGGPVRVCAFHFCVPDNPFYHALKVVFTMTLDKPFRSRLKFHVGQVTELQYLVQGYGIPVDHIPLTGTGNVKTQNLRVWLKLRSNVENPKEESAEKIIECPGSSDVLFRPSKLIKGHRGNVQFYSLIEYYHEFGLGTTNASKKIIADIHEGNGRILVWDKRGWWTTLTDPAQIQFKVSVAYRDYKKKNKGKIQSHNSSTFAFQEQDGTFAFQEQDDKKRKLGDQDAAGSSSPRSRSQKLNNCNFLNVGSSHQSSASVTDY